MIWMNMLHSCKFKNNKLANHKLFIRTSTHTECSSDVLKFADNNDFHLFFHDILLRMNKVVVIFWVFEPSNVFNFSSTQTLFCSYYLMFFLKNFCTWSVWSYNMFLAFTISTRKIRASNHNAMLLPGRPWEAEC